MRSLDRPLLRWGGRARLYIAVSVVLGLLRALLLVAQAWLLATVVAGAFIRHEGLTDLLWPMQLLLLVVVLRAAVSWTAEVTANRCSARVKSTMRSALAERVAVLGGDGQPVGRPGDLVALATGGIDALDGYYGRYLPQTILAVIVPVTVIVAVGAADWVSAVILVVTLPMIPVFMALIGWATRAQTDRQLRGLQLLSGHFLDVVSGLPTLKAFGRSKAQADVIRTVTDSYRRRLMSTLRVAFLSSMVLELVASISVALIAVAIGLRLLDGHIGFRSSLFVLVLAPEAYLPLRQLASDYHASSEGVSAAGQVLDVLSQPAPVRGVISAVPDPAVSGLAIEALRYTYPGRDRPALDGVSLVVEPGEVLALAGPSGCGKSTLLAVLLGLIVPDSGTVRAGGVDVASFDPAAWRSRIAWVPQRPHLFATTMADNVRLGRPGACEKDLERAIDQAGLSDLVARLPEGLATVLGERGSGLSAGERQRLALARAFLRDAPLLLLDEPTAALDGDTEAGVLAAVRRLTQHRTVLIVAHRPALLEMADRVVSLSAAPELAWRGVPA